MTTKIGKCLAIFTALCGIAFLGFAAATVVGGPNWRARMDDEDLRDYTFEASDDPEPVWSAKRLLGDEAVGTSSKIAPQAIVAARTDLQSKQLAEQEELETRLDRAKEDVAEAEKFIAEDKAAVDLRIAELEQELDAVNKKIEEVSNTIQQTAQQVRATQALAGRRQEDVRLYEAQLVQLRTDRFRILEQQKILRDQLVRIRGENDRLERRNEQLKQATGSP